MGNSGLWWPIKIVQSQTEASRIIWEVVEVCEILKYGSESEFQKPNRPCRTELFLEFRIPQSVRKSQFIEGCQKKW